MFVLAISALLVALVAAQTKHTWEGQFPVGRSGACTVELPSGDFFVFGGRTGISTWSNEAWTYSPSTGAWTLLTPSGSAPSPRSACGCVVTTGTTTEVYVFGGQLSATTYSNSFHKYIVSINAWATVNDAAPPAVRGWPTMWLTSTTADPNLVWLYGGTFGSDDYNDVWYYNVATRAWSSQNPALFSGVYPPKRAGMSVVWNAARTRFWFFGGSNHVGQVSGTPYNDVYFLNVNSGTYVMGQILGITGTLPAARETQNMALVDDNSFVIFGGDGPSAFGDVWKYTDTTKSWSQLSTGVQPPRTLAASLNSFAGGNNKLWIFGGSVSGDFSSSWIQWDVTTGAWINLGIPNPRSSHTGVVVGTEMIVYGGQSIASTGSLSPTGEVWHYSLTGGSWSAGASGVARYWHACCARGTDMVCHGGYDNSARMANTQVYNTGTRTWTSVSGGPAVSSLVCAGPGTTGTDLYFYGGQKDTNTWSAEIWKFSGSNVWTQITVNFDGTNGAPLNFNNQRQHASAVWKDNKLLIYGGSNSGTSYRSDAILWDPSAIGTATEYTPLCLYYCQTFGFFPLAIRGHKGLLDSDGSIVYWGGFTQTTGYEATLYRYYIGNNPAAPASSDIYIKNNQYGLVPQARAYHSSVLYNGKIYVYGGESNSGSSSPYVHVLSLTGAYVNPAGVATQPPTPTPYVPPPTGTNSGTNSGTGTGTGSPPQCPGNCNGRGTCLSGGCLCDTTCYSGADGCLANRCTAATNSPSGTTTNSGTTGTNSNTGSTNGVNSNTGTTNGGVNSNTGTSNGGVNSNTGTTNGGVNSNTGTTNGGNGNGNTGTTGNTGFTCGDDSPNQDQGECSGAGTCVGQDLCDCLGCYSGNLCGTFATTCTDGPIWSSASSLAAGFLLFLQ